MTHILETPFSPTATWSELGAGLETASPGLQRLSPAERMVAVLLQQGLSNREIAVALGKSVPTVKNQVSACLAKCGAPTRARLIASLR